MHVFGKGVVLKVEEMRVFQRGPSHARREGLEVVSVKCTKLSLGGTGWGEMQDSPPSHARSGEESLNLVINKLSKLTGFPAANK